MIFYLFTKTNWDEPPRIRHQLTNLLISDNHKVFFFQKPKLNDNPHAKANSLDRITLLRHKEFLHHQLRPNKYIQLLNGFYSKKNIKKVIKDIPTPDVIINFNYDYYFLRDIFPQTNIITLLNDDFVGAARLWMKKESNRVLLKTIEMSNQTLTVSNYIKDYLYPENDISLFLPWSQFGYHKPKRKSARNTILYFGYINSKRIDLDLFKKIIDCTNYNFIIIGFIEERSQRILKSIFENKRVKFLGEMAVESINFEQIFCSIAPYNIHHPVPKTITLNNRTLQLLSWGIPQLINRLPYLLNVDKRVVWQAETVDEFIEGLRYFNKNFYLVQKSIEKFVNTHSLKNRTEELMKIIGK